jgi:hypothetical protein
MRNNIVIGFFSFALAFAATGCQAEIPPTTTTVSGASSAEVVKVSIGGITKEVKPGLLGRYSITVPIPDGSHEVVVQEKDKNGNTSQPKKVGVVQGGTTLPNDAKVSIDGKGVYTPHSPLTDAVEAINASTASMGAIASKLDNTATRLEGAAGRIEAAVDAASKNFETASAKQAETVNLLGQLLQKANTTHTTVHPVNVLPPAPVGPAPKAEPKK